jgi:glycerophosphoryl diester phosphodiesterase
VQAFDWDFLRDCRKLSPKMVLGALCKEEVKASIVREAADIGVQTITWKQELLAASGIELIHSTGKQAWAYTVNDLPRAQELIEAGLDGLISNFPEELVMLRSKAC